MDTFVSRQTPVSDSDCKCSKLTLSGGIKFYQREKKIINETNLLFLCGVHPEEGSNAETSVKFYTTI